MGAGLAQWRKMHQQAKASRGVLFDLCLLQAMLILRLEIFFLLPTLSYCLQDHADALWALLLLRQQFQHTHHHISLAV